MDEMRTYLKPPERLLKAIEVAEILNISRAFAYRLIQQGKIRSVIIEGARRVRPEDLTIFIENSLFPPVGQKMAE